MASWRSCANDRLAVADEAVDDMNATAEMSVRAQAARVAGAQMLLGLIGAGIQRSLTPAMQEAEASAQGLKINYQLIDLDRTGEGVEALPALLRTARLLGFGGLNITFPCKQAVIPLLDELSEEARAMGAVNTVVVRGDRLVGHNTDGSGWCWGFERALPRADLSRVVLLGAGGAGSAIAHALLHIGCAQLIMMDRDTVRAKELASRLAAQYPRANIEGSSDATTALRGASGIVHATPTGMDKLPGMPIDAHLLPSQAWLSEIVYFPLETQLLKAARDKGLRTVDGGTMAVGQALDAFELFTGRRANSLRMDAHFRRLIAQGANA
jgi:shikimate dehydrogenase